MIRFQNLYTRIIRFFQFNFVTVIGCFVIFIALLYIKRLDAIEHAAIPIFKDTYDSNETIHWRWKNKPITFWCRYDGSAHISVEWIKDGLPIAPNSNRNIINQWSLKVLNLNKSDSGIYACNVSNQYGHLVRTFMLVVFEKILLGDIIVEDLSPKYYDVRQEGAEIFMCRIKSVVPFLLRWYRMEKPSLQPKSLIELKPKKTLLKVIYIEKFKQLSVSGWTDLNNSNSNLANPVYTINDMLILPNISLHDEGVYVCEAFRPTVASNKTAKLVISKALISPNKQKNTNDIFHIPFEIHFHMEHFVYIILILAGVMTIAGIVVVIAAIYSGCTSTKIYFSDW